MSERRETVAKALFDAGAKYRGPEYGSVPWKDIIGRHREMWLDLADAAIAILLPPDTVLLNRDRAERLLAAAIEMKRSAEWYGFIRAQVSALQPGDLDPLPEPAAGAHDGRE